MSVKLDDGWKMLFEEHILYRGREYYECGNVSEVHECGTQIVGAVNGTRPYNVVISTSGECVTSMSCTCPYAEDGNHCKHMAAVLYKWKYDNASHRKGTPSSLASQAAAPSLESMVRSADESVVRDFLLQVLKAEESYRKRFKLLVDPHVSREEMNRYFAQIDHIMEDLENSIQEEEEEDYSYYDLEDEDEDSFSNCFERMQEMFCEDVQMMIDNACCREASELITYAFLALNEFYARYRSADSLDIADKCRDYWLKAIDAADDGVRDEMLDQFLDLAEGDTLETKLRTYLEKIILARFNSPAQIRKKLAFTERRLDALEAGSGGNLKNNPLAGKWALEHLMLLESSGAGKEELEAYAKSKWAYTAVRKHAIEKALSKSDYIRAEDMLKESIVLDGKDRRQVFGYWLTLKDMYRQLGYSRMYKEAMWEIVLKHAAGKMEYYLELKSLYDRGEWEKLRGNVENCKEWEHFLPEYYNEEKLYDRLLQLIQKCNDLNLVQKYKEGLAKAYPKEVLDVYEHTLQDLVLNTADRKTYREWAFLLWEMKTIPGGDERVRSILGEWRIRYKNRRAMLDEMKAL